MKRRLLAVLVAATLALAGSTAFAIEQTLVISGNDSYETWIGVNRIGGGSLFAGDIRAYGGLTWFGANEPGSARGLLRFDVSSLAGQYVSLTSVTMRLYQETGASSLDIDAHRITPVNSNWQETTDTGSYTSWGGTWNQTTWSTRLRGASGMPSAGWTGNGPAGGLGMPGGAGYDIKPFGGTNEGGTGATGGVGTWTEIPIVGDIDTMMAAWVQNPVYQEVNGLFGTWNPDNQVLNEGFLLKSLSGMATWYSSEYDDVGGGASFPDEWAPQLVIVYDDGQGAWPPGDFDHDMDVDNDDIDMLCDFIRLGLPYDAEYDISADGTSGGSDAAVDVLDLDYHVRSLVETLIGNGTEYGDFNLDGLIDTTDLTRLATNYGDDDWKWDDGNANRNIDTNIDNTDLTILATYYGTGPGDPDVVPEPMTLSLLAVGGAALLRRRK